MEPNAGMVDRADSFWVKKQRRIRKEFILHQNVAFIDEGRDTYPVIHYSALKERRYKTLLYSLSSDMDEMKIV